MRALLVILHRYVGLAIASFLVMAGITGAAISWDHELDALLNGHLLESRASGAARPSLDLAREIEARYPHAAVTYIPLAPETGHSLMFGVDPRVDSTTGELYNLGFNQVLRRRNVERTGRIPAEDRATT